MTTTNPLLKATRAAFTELTTPEAQAWFRAQAKATAAGAMAIAHRGIATVGHLLRPKQELLTGGEVPVPEKDSIKDVAVVDALELCEFVDVDLIFPIPTNGRKETTVQRLRGSLSITSETSGSNRTEESLEGELLDKDATELRSNAIASAAVVEVAPSSVPFGWAAIEANDVAVVPVLRGGQSIISQAKSEDKAITVASVDAEDDPSEEVSEDEGEEPETEEERQGGS